MAPTHGTREQPAGKGGSVAMKTEKRTTPEAPREAQRYGRVRPYCGPQFYKDSRAHHADKPKNQRRSAKSLRKGSRYPPGSEFRPSEERLRKRTQQVLELLKERGPRGVTKLDAPSYLSLSLSARVCDLRSKGYRIDTLRERVGDACIARYVLVPPEPVPEAGATP